MITMRALKSSGTRDVSIALKLGRQLLALLLPVFAVVGLVSAVLLVSDGAAILPAAAALVVLALFPLIWPGIRQIAVARDEIASPATIIVGFSFVLVASDIDAITVRQLPYLVAFVVIFATFRARKTDGVSQNDVAISLFLAVGILGAAYGRVVLGQDENPLAFFGPAVVALCPLWRPYPLSTEGNVNVLLRLMLFSSIVFEAFAVLTNVLVFPFLPPEDFRHERIFFLVIGIAIAILQRRYLVISVLSICGIANFVSYPALTEILVVIGSIVIYFVMSHPRSIRSYIAMIGAPAGLFIAYFFVDGRRPRLRLLL